MTAHSTLGCPSMQAQRVNGKMSRKRYREYRKLLGTQVEAAKQLGVTPNTVSRRELGYFPITREAALVMDYLVTKK